MTASEVMALLEEVEWHHGLLVEALADMRKRHCFTSRPKDIAKDTATASYYADNLAVVLRKLKESDGEP